MSSLIREPKYLRILTPKTNRGRSPKADEFGRPTYKESHVRYNKQTIRAFESINKFRPSFQKIIVEVVENPDYVETRKSKAMSAGFGKTRNPRPAGENKMPSAESAELAALRRELAELKNAKPVTAAKASEKRLDRKKQLNDLVDKTLSQGGLEYQPLPDTSLKDHSNENTPV